ncbi:MAG: uracil-xanthine permease [Lachnospiraceae bacterium]|nr:uracil-xanthine permease [Lachnospiraceae bacterium]
MIYQVEDRPAFGKNLVFAIQQLLAIIAATLLVPTLVNLSSASADVQMSQPAALFGAGVGTLLYLLITRRKSPIFLGSSFAFISPLIGATAFGYLGIILGAIFAGAVYTLISVIVHFAGTGWVDKLMPTVIIGPTVALIGLSLCSSAVNNLNNTAGGSYNLIHILCGLIAFLVTTFASVKGNKTAKAIPFIIGILAGYVVAAIFTAIGNAAGIDYLKVVDFTPLVENFSPFTVSSLFAVPDFTIVKAAEQGSSLLSGAAGVANIALLFIPVSFVVFAEHIADHKNLSSIIGRDLIKDPGLDKTVLGDGLGSIAGAIFGGCPNTSYGESIGCIAITRNASTHTITLTAILCLIVAFLKPVVAFINTIPTCIVGGICVALYGFIAVSGLRMIQQVDLNNNKNLFVVSVILVLGIGGLVLNFGPVQITSIATALIMGIILNLILKDDPKKED